MVIRPVTRLLSSLPEKPICISCSGSVKTGSLIFLVDSNLYFKFLPQLMHAMHVVHLFSRSFLIPDHQNRLLSASIFVEPGCPKCSASTTCFFNSSGITILSPVRNKPNRLISSLKTGENSSGAHSLRLFCKRIFNCNSFRSTKVFWIRFFTSTKKFNSAFLRFSSASATFLLGFSIT